MTLEGTPELDVSDRGAAVVTRALAKDAVAREVAAGRMPLREAAARFRDLDAQWPPGIPAPPPLVSARSPADHSCALVLYRVRHRLREEPGPARELLARLEAEREGLWRSGALGPAD